MFEDKKMQKINLGLWIDLTSGNENETIKYFMVSKHIKLFIWHYLN